ncbi:MAG: hypothetical protein ACOYWZ_12090 [Bacillota bacterium]
MEEILRQMLNKLEKLEIIANKIDRIESDISALNNTSKQMDNKIDSITNVVANLMEGMTEVKANIKEQEVEIKVIKGGRVSEK